MLLMQNNVSREASAGGFKTSRSSSYPFSPGLSLLSKCSAGERGAHRVVQASPVSPACASEQCRHRVQRVPGEGAVQGQGVREEVWHPVALRPPVLHLLYPLLEGCEHTTGKSTVVHDRPVITRATPSFHAKLLQRKLSITLHCDQPLCISYPAPGGLRAYHRRAHTDGQKSNAPHLYSMPILLRPFCAYDPLPSALCLSHAFFTKSCLCSIPIYCTKPWLGLHSLPLFHASTVQEPGQVPSVPLDLENAVRACPVCRVRSHYVTPSVVWFFSPEEKQEIVGGYKHKLK